jgi:hypothetical protein
MLGLALISGLIGSATAQTTDGAAPSQKKVDAKKATRSVSGTVKSSSPEAVVVAGHDKGRDAEWTFAVEPTTFIRKGSKSITARDLKAGDVVQVRFSEMEGKAMAQSIVVRPKKDAVAKKTKS